MIHSTYVPIHGEPIPVDLEVGPMPDNTYAYGYVDQNGWILSEHRYANAQSAIHDARRPQQMNLHAHLEPAP